MTAKPTEWGNFGKLVPDNIQENPLYVENLGYWYLYFSPSKKIKFFGARSFFTGELKQKLYLKNAEIP